MLCAEECDTALKISNILNKQTFFVTAKLLTGDGYRASERSALVKTV
jgi:hypothetical protein